MWRLTSLMVVLPLYLAAATWTAPVTLGNASSNYATIKIDSQGNAYAVWTYSIGNVSIIQAAKQVAGESEWTPPIILSQPLQKALYANLAIDSQDNVIAIWSASDGQREGIQAAYLPAGKKQWKLTQAIPFTPSLQIVSTPKIVFDGQGTALAVWGTANTSGNDTVYSIQSARLSDKTNLAWTALTEVPQTYCRSCDLAINASGNAVLVWIGLDGVRTAMLASSSPAWVVQPPLSTPYLASSFQAVIDDNNNAVVAWWEGGDEIANRAFSLPSGATQWIETTLPDTYAFDPRLRLDGSGTAYILYAAYGDENQTYTFRFSTLPPQGTVWTAPLTVLGPSTSWTAYYELGVDKAGNAIAVWSNDLSDTNRIIQTSLLPAGATSWSTPTETATNGVENWPKIALAQNGKCVIAYTQYTKLPPVYPWQYTVQTMNGSKLFNKNEKGSAK